MKSRYVFVLVLVLTGIAFNSCKDESNNDTPQVIHESLINAGNIMTYSLVADNDTLVKMQDEAVDFGVTKVPAIMLVHKQTLILEDGYSAVFFPLDREKLANFMSIWAVQFHLVFVTDEDKAWAYRDFISFYVTNDIDPGLLVELVVGNGRALAPIVSMIDETNSQKAAAIFQTPAPNDLLYMLYLNSKITTEELIAQYHQIPELKQGVAIFMMTLNAIIIAEKWMNFTLDNEPVEDFEANYASFVSEQDTIPSHYSGGTFFQTRDYKLSYDVGLWEAKATYHIEGTYADIHPTIPGYYVASFNTIPTYIHVNGTGFIVDGKTSYSPPANIGTFDIPVGTYDGQVKVTYGDCCCFRKISYLNFRINSQTGYEEVSFSSGKLITRDFHF